MAEQGEIRSFIDGSVGWLVVDNARRHNAVSFAMWKALPTAVSRLDEDPAVRVIVLRGGGEETFVSGADISEFATVRQDAETSRAYEASNEASFAALRSASKPTIAMIRGFCMGGGMGLAAACDIRIGAEGSTFAIPAARLGLAYPPDAIADFVRLLGPSSTKDLIFTARRFDADEAKSLGFLDHLVARDALAGYVADYVSGLADLAPLTQMAAKSAIAALETPTGSPERKAALAAADRCFNSADYAEGRAAFAEKRKPAFSGR